MRLLYLKSAREDVAWMRRYYRDVFPKGADKARHNLLRTETVLCDNPFIGRLSADFDGVREFPVYRTPFLMIYRPTDEAIQVLRVWDGRRDPASLKL